VRNHSSSYRSSSATPTAVLGAALDASQRRGGEVFLIADGADTSRDIRST
jgi:hypothetical protein